MSVNQCRSSVSSPYQVNPIKVSRLPLKLRMHTGRVYWLTSLQPKLCNLYLPLLLMFSAIRLIPSELPLLIKMSLRFKQKLTRYPAKHTWKLCHMHHRIDTNKNTIPPIAIPVNPYTILSRTEIGNHGDKSGVLWCAVEKCRERVPHPIQLRAIDCHSSPGTCESHRGAHRLQRWLCPAHGTIPTSLIPSINKSLSLLLRITTPDRPFRWSQLWWAAPMAQSPWPT